MIIGQGRPGLTILFRQFLARLPQFCCFCHQKTNTGRDLCRYCEHHLPQICDFSSKNGSTLCLRCGSEWPFAQDLQLCACCAKYRTEINQIISPYRYGFPIDYLISRLKYQQHLPTGRLLGSLLAQQVKLNINIDQFPDILLPVPLSRERYQQRGFNHANEIARSCGLELGIPVYDQSVGRHFDTGSLAGLTRAERGARIRGAFWAAENLNSARIAIVDDVLTTGATSGELATELRDSGVNECQLWVLARTPVSGAVSGS